jgi:hypothetical protein
MRIASVSGCSVLSSISRYNSGEIARDRELLLADRCFQVFDGRDDPLDGVVRGLERAHDLGLAHLFGARLNHDDAVLGAGDDEVEEALLALGVGRVDDELVVNQANADPGDRLLERDFRDCQRR